MRCYLILFMLVCILQFTAYSQIDPINSKRITGISNQDNPKEIINTGSWEVLYPGIPVQNYSAVWFKDSITGFIAGDHGKILKTTDTGIKWTIVAESDTRSFNRLTSNDKGTNLIAVGMAGLIKVSSDMGDTWQSVTLTNKDIWSIDYRNNEIWISGLDNSLYKSTDNGLTWDSVVTGYNRDLWEINFYDSLNAVIGCDSGYVLLTSDGGESWSSVKTMETGGIFSIKYVTANRISFGTETLNFYYSSDSGKTWQKCTYPQYGGVVVEDIEYRDSLFGYAVTNGFILHYETTDGGISWDWKNPLYGNQSIQFVDDKLAYTIGYEMEFWKSTDGGKEWEQVKLNQDFTDIQITNNDEIILTTYGISTIRTGMWKTNNKFEKITPYDMSRKVLFLEFLNKDTGFAFTDLNVQKTTDKGKHWKIVSVFADSSIGDLPTNVRFINNNIGYYTTFYRLRKTTDCGETWVDLPVKPSHNVPINSVDFYDEQLGFYLADSIYRTTDGGLHWKNVPNIYRDDFGEIKIISLNDMWAIGLNTCYHSIDSGKTWQLKDAMNGQQIIFVNTQTGFALNNNGNLWKTTNRGLTWVWDSEISGLKVLKMRYYEREDGKADLYIVGQDGLILRKNSDIPLSVIENEGEIKYNSDVSVYPNPFSNQLNIRTGNSENNEVNLEIFSITGERVYQKNMRADSRGDFKISGLKNLTPGVYFLRLNLKNKVLTQKILKTR